VDNKFVFIAPMHNASKTLQQMLLSIYVQSYKNWQLILIDDVSDEDHIIECQSILSDFHCMHDFTEDKITVVWNTEKKWETANVLRGISMCSDKDIICRIDADDYLTDTDCLMYMNNVYNQTNAEALWSAHRWGMSDKNISGPMPRDADPYKYPWISSHLKSFRKCLLNNIPYENFTNMNGDLVRRCGDQAIYLPVLKCAKIRGYVPRVFYHYTIDEQGGAVYQTEDAKFQKQEADFIRQRGYVSVGEPWENILQFKS
jgi:glycosyltransferase involved in cell wall biosynthesis